METEEPVVFDAENLPVVVAPENVEQWNAIEASGIGPRMKRALMRVAGGENCNQAAFAEGYGSVADVYRYATKYKLVDLSTNKIVQQHRSIANLANNELEKRLLETPEEIKERDLIVASGVATDKVFMHEKNSTDDGRGYLSNLEEVAKAFRESGAEVDITVKIRPSDDSNTVQTDLDHGEAPHPVIDVTPQPSGEPTQPD